MNRYTSEECVNDLLELNFGVNVPPKIRQDLAHLIEIARAEGRPLLAESDLIEFYKQRMKEHRDNAIASRKRVEELEKKIVELQAECRKASREILDLILAETNATIEDSAVNGSPFEILRRMIAERNSLRTENDRLRAKA